jgi:LEA14-like dessication related protein
MNLPLKRSGEIPVPAIPEISLATFDVDTLSLEKISGTAKLRIRNINEFAIDLSQIRFDLAMGGKKVASTQLRNTSKLAPGQSATVDLPIAVSPRTAGAGLLNLLAGNDAGYAISGRLDVMTRYGELALPFSQSGNTAVRHR